MAAVGRLLRRDSRLVNELTPLNLRRQLQRPRTRLAALGCVLALGGVVALHHSPVPGAGMDMPGMGMVCLAVIGAGLAAAALCAPPRRVGHPSLTSRRAAMPPPRTPAGAPAARAGPPLFLRLSSLRR